MMRACRVIAVLVSLGIFTILGTAPQGRGAPTRMDNGSDPGDNRVDDDDFWTDFPEGGIGVGPGDVVWIGKMNQHHPDRVKCVSLKVTLVGFAGWLSHAGAAGYIAGTPPSRAEQVGPVRRKEYLQEVTFKVTFVPQPDWEWIKLKNTGKTDPLEIRTADYTTVCYKRIGQSKKWYLKPAHHKDPDSLALTELTIFPDNADVDTDSIPAFAGPAGSGNWSYEFVTLNPYTNETMPYIGVRWTTDGPGIAQGEANQYEMSLTLTDSTVQWFSYYVYDNLTGEIYAYDLLGLAPSAIPTLTEWGLIVFGVVLLGFITWVFLKRRKAVAVKA